MAPPIERRAPGLRILGLVSLLLLLAAPTGAAGAALTAEQLAPLTERNLRAVEDAVDAIAASGTPAALSVLEALGDGRLHATPAGRVLVESAAGEGFVDPLTGEAVAAPDAERIRVSNRIRRAVSAAVAELGLGADDPEVRLAAARRFLEAPDEDLLPRLERALAEERDPRVAAALETARAATVFADRDRPEAERLAAVERLQAVGTATARSALLSGFAEEDSRLDLRRREAVMEIDRILARWGYLQNLWYGLSLGSVLLLAALGLAITFGVMGVINMAHGELVMLGAYTTFVVQAALKAVAPGLLDASLLLALPLAFGVAGGVGMLLERTVIRRLYGRPLETLLATWGISLILQQAVRTVFGASNRPVETVSWMSGAFELGQLTFTWNRVAIVLFALAVLAAVALVLRRTPLGLQIRAVTQNRAMAEAVGIRSARVDLLTFGLGSGIAGMAGVALSQIDNVSPNLGQSYLIDSFLVIVFGGVGNLLGTLVGAFTLGIAGKIVEPLAGAVAAKVAILLFIVLFIQFRPRGLFPQKGRAAE